MRGKVARIFVGSGHLERQANRYESKGWTVGPITISDAIQKIIDTLRPGDHLHLAGGDTSRCVRGVAERAARKGTHVFINFHNTSTGDRKQNTLTDRMTDFMQGLDNTPIQVDASLIHMRPKRILKKIRS